MFSKYLSGIEDVEIYPIIVLVVFFSLFVFVLVKVTKMDKALIDKMGNMPLEDDPEIENKDK
ncbi:MAG: hypothetical protein SCALA702_37670 [Melioribacteraceae bacterium]|nr:MAG: hypothetical protein SCALA702_37670 [Melioribacteraceae bacterium]